MHSADDNDKRPVEILVVEDSRTQAEQLRHVLERQGYGVTVAGDGEAALAQIARRLPDLVITDVNMPVMDGYELCRRIKQDAVHAAIPVMLLTTLTDPVDVIHGLECGADNFTVKPYDRKQLLSRVAYMLANRHLREAERNSIGIAVTFAGRKFFVNSDRLQILNLLLSTYETAVQQNADLVQAQLKLREWNEQLEQKIEERTVELRNEIAERARAEHALRESEERFRLAMHNTPIGMALVSPDGRWLEVNQALCRIVGYSEEELLKSDFQTLTHPDDLQKSVELVRQILTRQIESYGVEKRYVHKDGRNIWVNLHVSLVWESADMPRYFIAQIQDITDRVRTMEALRLNEASLRIALETVDMALFRQDLDLRYTWIHRSKPVYGPAEILGCTDADMMPAGDAAKITAIKRSVIDTGNIVRETVCIRNSHGPLYYDLVVEPLRDPDGNTVGITGSSLNITARVVAEDAKKESDALFRGILQAAPDAVIIVDSDGRIVLSNPVAAEAFGYADADLIGASIEMLVPEARRESHVRQRGAFQMDPSQRRVGANRRLEGRRKDGSTFPVEVGLSPLITPYGVYVVAIVRDVTERRLLEQQLQQSQKMEAIGQLTGGLAHDFNNLLGVVLGNLDILEQTVGDSERALKRVATAQKAAIRGADLTKRLLAFSRRQQLNPEPTSLNEAVRNMIEMASRTLGPAIGMSTKLNEVPPVLVDASGLENVLLNLAINSRDAMPEGGKLTVATKIVNLDEHYPAVRAGELKPGSYACVSVSDTGHGMDRATLDRIFEPFFTTKPRGKGTGLGLSMVYGFVKQSGGHLNVYSEVDHGTRVTIYLPFAEGVETRSGIGRQPAPKIEGGATVLVVDDEVDLLEVAVSYLEEMGFRVLHATDGPGALEICGREPGIGLLLTDVVMPGGMSGAELSRRVRELLPGIRIVYSTGFSSDALTERSGLLLDSVVLSKPYRRHDFAAAIHRAMKRDNDDGNSDNGKTA